jgi:hypothetical protein
MEVGAASTANMDPMMGPSGPQKRRKKRIRNWTAEDRAVHREFEKSRREAFSERLAVGHDDKEFEGCLFTNLLSGVDDVTAHAEDRAPSLQAYHRELQYRSAQSPAGQECSGNACYPSAYD